MELMEIVWDEHRCKTFHYCRMFYWTAFSCKDHEKAPCGSRQDEMRQWVHSQPHGPKHTVSAQLMLTGTVRMVMRLGQCTDCCTDQNMPELGINKPGCTCQENGVDRPLWARHRGRSVIGPKLKQDMVLII